MTVDLKAALQIRHTYLDVFVPGVPVQQGSKNIGRARGGRAFMYESNVRKLKPWRKTLCSHFSTLWGDREPLDRPLRLDVVFHMPRPKSHYRGNNPDSGELKAAAPIYCDRRPDRDKLLRALCDGIEEAGVVRDDARFVAGQTTKRYAEMSQGCGVYVLLRSV